MTAELQSLWAGQSRAGPGRARQVQTSDRCCFLLHVTTRACCTMRCWGGGGNGLQPPSAPPRKWGAAFTGAERLAAFPIPGARGAVLQPTLHPCSAGREKKPKHISGRLFGSKQAPAARQRWGGRIRPWAASFSVLLIPTDSASDANNSPTLMNGDVYTRGSVKGRNQSSARLSAGLREAGCSPCSRARVQRHAGVSAALACAKQVCKCTAQTPASPSRGPRARCFTPRHAFPNSCLCCSLQRSQR